MYTQLAEVTARHGLPDRTMLRGVGETKGRHYVRGESLAPLIDALGPRPALDDPYPWMRARLAEPAAVDQVR